MAAESKEFGISIRFIQASDATRDLPPSFDVYMSSADVAVALAMRDPSNRPFADKLADAIEFVATRPRIEPLLM